MIIERSGVTYTAQNKQSSTCQVKQSINLTYLSQYYCHLFVIGWAERTNNDWLLPCPSSTLTNLADGFKSDSCNESLMKSHESRHPTDPVKIFSPIGRCQLLPQPQSHFHSHSHWTLFSTSDVVSFLFVFFYGSSSASGPRSSPYFAQLVAGNKDDSSEMSSKMQLLI